MQTQTTNYEQQAIDFLQSTGTEFTVKFLRNGKHFSDDKETRDIYEITLKRGSRVYTFEFGQSIVNSGFYYTKARQKTQLDIKYLTKPKSELAYFIQQKIDFSFMNNGKSDVIHYPVTPTAYDVLACLTKNDPGTFENFCSEYGYDTDSVKAGNTYEAVYDEWLNVAKLFTDAEIEQLQEIS